MNRYRRHHAIGSIGWADCFECAQQRLQLSYVLVSWRMSATTETAFHRNGRRPFLFPSPCGFSLHSPHRHLPAKDQRLNASAHSVSCSFHCPTHSNALKSHASRRAPLHNRPLPVAAAEPVHHQMQVWLICARCVSVDDNHPLRWRW